MPRLSLAQVEGTRSGLANGLIPLFSSLNLVCSARYVRMWQPLVDAITRSGRSKGIMEGE